MARKIKIYSRRFNVAKGNHWQEERECTEATVQEWLAIFRKDEPNICFIGNNRKPAK